MFLGIKVFEALCASIFGKDLEKIRIPEKIMGLVNTLIESVLMILIAMDVLGFILSLYIPMFRMAEQF